MPDLIGYILYAVALTGGGYLLSSHMTRVYAGERNLLSRFLTPVERGFYSLAGIRPGASQGWRGYTIAVLTFNLAGFCLLYVILRLQNLLPLNPDGIAAMAPDLAFNTAVSFVTNTNWQAYSGEVQLSYLAQMAGLTVQNFVSAATGRLWPSL